jgi:hypothetical protein
MPVVCPALIIIFNLMTLVGLQIMKFLLKIKFIPASYCFLCVGSKYSPQHSILKHVMFIPYREDQISQP